MEYYNGRDVVGSILWLKIQFRKLHVSCQYSRFKHLNFKYIYLISYKIAKKANPRKRICPH